MEGALISGMPLAQGIPEIKSPIFSCHLGKWALISGMPATGALPYTLPIITSNDLHEFYFILIFFGITIIN
jgi:hypothetical protein